MNHQRWIKPLLITLLLCCAAPLSVADDEPAAPLQKQKATEHLAQTTEPFTIAVLPDTQFYCDTRLKLSAKWGNGDLRRYFFAQTEWVRDNQERLNISFLVHEGDIVQADAPEEWAIAKEAMSVLDGKVPYCMCLGNHDMGFEKADNKYGGNIGVNRTTHFNTYFPRDKFAERPEFGGTFDPDRHDNSWYHFEAAGKKFLIVALECKPRDEVLDWANQVVAKHPDHRVIVLTHAYMNASKSRNTGGMKAEGNTGEQTWQKFVRKHKNIFMVLCGHHAGEAVRTDAGEHGNQVHQILCDYQEMNNGGESWLRYMVFKPGAKKISIYTYNPALGKFKNGPSSRFDLDYPMALPPVTVPEITRPGAANDVNKEAEQDGADQPATAPKSKPEDKANLNSEPKGEARAATVDDIFFAARSPAASKPLGLRPGPNATILLNRKPYRGIGINYFSCFLRTLKDGNDTSYDAGFATLAEKGIPFARFCATGFWPRDMKLYVENREEYFRRLDGVVNAAEKHGIGLVPSLFWYYACVPDLVGEPMDQWANPNSKTQAWMRNYVREVVTRYRDNPTIWAWELGNEFSLHGDLPNAEHGRPKTHRSLGTPDSRSARDDLTYEMIGEAFTAFATAVRKHDPHRLIFTGDSFPRLSAWHQQQEGSWKHDSMEQFAEMLTKANPDPISGISLHVYKDDDQRLDVAMAVGRKLNKPVFVGEFGAQHETPEQNAKCRRLLKAIIDHKIPLAALWVFDHPHQKDFNVTADNGRAWQLDLIAEANRKLRTQAASRAH